MSTSRHERIGSLGGDDNFFYSFASDLAGEMFKQELDRVFDVGQRLFLRSPLADGSGKLDALD